MRAKGAFLFSPCHTVNFEPPNCEEHLDCLSSATNITPRFSQTIQNTVAHGLRVQDLTRPCLHVPVFPV